MERKTHKIKSRITFIFCCFTLFIVAIFSTFTWFLVYLLEDALLNNQLNIKTKAIQSDLSSNSDLTTLNNRLDPHFRIYIGVNSLPIELANSGISFSPGNYELYGKEDRHYHVAVRILPSQEELIVIYDVTDLLVVRKFRGDILLLMIGGTIFFVLVGLTFALVTSRIAVSPLSKLVDWAKSISFGSSLQKVSNDFREIEIVALAESLESSLVRIHKFVERERLFNRDVSHELRTPITVIKGVLELINRSEKNKKPIRREWLDRFKISVENMEFIVEAFLWLSKELPDDEKQHQTEVRPLVEKSIKQYNHLIEMNPVDIKIFEKAENVKIDMPPQVFSIAFGNLLKNAFQSTDKGNIQIILEPNQISIQDTGKGMEPDQIKSLTQPWYQGSNSTGFGLGLSIVQRLCDQFGGSLQIESSPGKGSTVKIILS